MRRHGTIVTLVVNELILVDNLDNEIGYGSIEDCHSGGLKRHRAFSVFLFNDRGEMLITQRSAGKKTWPLFWSNACCSHPRRGETCESAARRRLVEELGISVDVQFLFKFEYDAQYDEIWGEHELDWVFDGSYSGQIQPNAEELMDWKFVPIAELLDQIRQNPERFTPWFLLSLERVLDRRNAF
jgi:isopentenyl-diphosphate delta-isomerase